LLVVGSTVQVLLLEGLYSTFQALSLPEGTQLTVAVVAPMFVTEMEDGLAQLDCTQLGVNEVSVPAEGSLAE
jgi:hypothetical protein